MLVQFSTKIKAAKRLHTQQHDHSISHMLPLRIATSWVLQYITKHKLQILLLIRLICFLHQDHRESFTQRPRTASSH